jgi:hypothetical protein
MNTPRHHHANRLAGLFGIGCASLLAGCISVPLGSHDESERVCGERLRGDHGNVEQIVVRTHYSDYYAVLTLDNFGRQWTRSERFFLKRGAGYTALPFLNGKRGDVATFFRPVQDTELWVAIREDKVVDMDYSNLTVMLFGEGGMRRRISLRMARRDHEYVFSHGNRNLEVELKGARAVLNLTNGNHFIVPRKNGAEQEK